MALIPVNFEYLTGLRQPLLHGARLSGSWNADGRYAEQWSNTPMQPFTAADGCPAFRATVSLDGSQLGREFHWGVRMDTAQQPDLWGITMEVNDANSRELYRHFTLQQADQTERYYLTHCRRLGANKLYRDDQNPPGICFAVWAPNARHVELVRGEPVGGYIWKDGRGITATISMHRDSEGIWSTEVGDAPVLAGFAEFDHTPYMFRITRDDGSVVYRTDLCSRCQIGSGGVNPETTPSWSGRRQDLDGSKSCSVVIDPERVTETFHDDAWPETRWLPAEDFWRDEFDPDRPLPSRLEDLVIYGLNVESLGVDLGVDHGIFEDAIDLLDYLTDLGVNGILLMPMAASGRAGWGYTVSLPMTMGYAHSAGDPFKHFVRACHRRGVAVILDVDYSHFTFSAERAHWAYDSSVPDNNLYYWYEGRSSDYPHPDGGYIDNGTLGWAPRWWEEMVRKMFISSAAMLLNEFHLDGLRLAMVNAIYSGATLHADSRLIDRANHFGAKFLRELSRSLKLIKPSAFLIGEDWSVSSPVTLPTDLSGFGFDAVSNNHFSRHLVGGDEFLGSSQARLIELAVKESSQPLAMDLFAQVLSQTKKDQIVSHEPNNTVDNMIFPGFSESKYRRTIEIAANIDNSRRSAEALCRLAGGMTLLAPGTPMLLMGAEVGATTKNWYLGDGYLSLQRHEQGRRLFIFYQDIIRLRLCHSSFRSPNIKILSLSNADRVIGFRRWVDGEDCVVVASLNATPFASGYRICGDQIPDAEWREIFNSDAMAYGGSGLSNQAMVRSASGSLIVAVPAMGFVIFRRQ